jgi:hypothetical protein
VARVAVRAQAPAAGSAAIVPFKIQVPDAVMSSNSIDVRQAASGREWSAGAWVVTKNSS